MWVRYNSKLGKPVIFCMNNPEILTPENEERKHELIELVVSGEAVLIVGAGSSARVGYVTWDGLLKKLEDLADQYDWDFEKDEEKRVRKPLEYAEDIKSHIREKEGDLGKYYDLLCDLFEPKPQTHDEFHRLLVDLPFRGILTTNYDTVLEEALLDKKLEAEREGRQIRPIDRVPLVIGLDAPRLIHEFLLARHNDPHIRQRIAHLHGLYRYQESIILTANDYIKAYGQYVAENNETENIKTESNDEVNTKEVWTLHRKLLWAVLATRRVVFVGFSMKDPYFNKMLEIVSADLWGWNKSIHFAIMGISAEDKENIQDSKDKADRLKSKYGIETVFYEVIEKSHKRLEDIFADIKKQCENRSQSSEEAQNLSSDSDSSENEELKPVSSGSRDILDWLKREGQRLIRRISDED